MRSVLLLLIALVSISDSGVLAQEQTSSTKSTCSICINGMHLEGSPYDFNIKSEWPFLAVGVMSTAAGIVAQSINHPTAFTNTELMNLDRRDIFFVDRGAANNWSPASARASDIVRSTSILLPAFFLTNHHTKKEISMLLVMSLEVLTTNFGATQLVKNIVNRARPFTYNTDLLFTTRSKKNDKLSFFSGHTSHTAAFSFFIAKVLTDYHPNARNKFKVIVWSIAVLIPATTAVLRVKAGKHFPTDVIAGYVVGASIGYLIPQLHKQKKRKLNNLSIIPAFTGGGGGVRLFWKFR